MDPTTSEVRKAQWIKIVAACQARPSGMTAKQWLAENEVREKAYYYWQRRLRKDAYEQMQQSGDRDLLPATKEASAVSFAELPFSTQESSSVKSQVGCAQPVAAVQLQNAQIMISNDISPDLLRCILQEVSHA